MTRIEHGKVNAYICLVLDLSVLGSGIGGNVG